LNIQIVALCHVGIEPKSVTDPGQVTATTLNITPQQPFDEPLRKCLFLTALANTADAALLGHPYYFQFPQLLTDSDHLLPLLVLNVTLNRLHRDRACGRDELAAGPQTGQAPFHPGIFLVDRVRSVALILPTILSIPGDGAQSINRWT
jgi:hypothetical protein